MTYLLLLQGMIRVEICYSWGFGSLVVSLLSLFWRGYLVQRPMRRVTMTGVLPTTAWMKIRGITMAMQTPRKRKSQKNR